MAHDTPCPAGMAGYTQFSAKPKNMHILPIRKQPSVSKSRLIYRPEDDISVHSTSKSESKTPDDSIPPLPLSTAERTRGVRISLNDLPAEIQEGIIDHLYGTLGSAALDMNVSSHGSRNWSMAMRHPRRKQLSDLSLVSKVWRILIQQRLYRHSDSIHVLPSRLDANL